MQRGGFRYLGSVGTVNKAMQIVDRHVCRVVEKEVLMMAHTPE